MEHNYTNQNRNKNINDNCDNQVKMNIPSWIVWSKFEPVFKEICDGFKSLKEFRVKRPLAVGENYATIMLRLEADIQLHDGSTITKSLMLKTAHSDAMLQEMMKEYDFFHMESAIYTDVIPELEQMYKDIGIDVKFGPKFYELRDTEEPHILLENLHERNFRNLNRLEGLDEHHTKHALTKMAQWHAGTATRSLCKGPYSKKFIEGFFKPSGLDKMSEYFNNLTKCFMESIKQYNGHEIYYDDLINTIDNMTRELFKCSTLADDDKEFHVLNHGDFWSNNVMFQHDADGNILETYLVDFQMIKFGAPAQDLYYFLLSSTKYDIKLARFDYFIAYYHRQLVKYLKLLNYPGRIPTLKDIHIQLFKHSVWGLSTTVGVMAAVLLEPNKNACIDNFLGDTDTAVDFKRQMYTNERYRKHAEAILPWLYYRGLLELS